MRRSVNCSDIARAVGMDCLIVGDETRTVQRIAPIEVADAASVCFCSKRADTATRLIGASLAGVIVCTPEVGRLLPANASRTLILVDRPRLAFIRIVRELFVEPRVHGIHPTAVISPEAQLGRNVYVGPFTFIGRASVGDGTIIDGHAHIYDNVRIGNDCTLHAGVVLGGASLGLERDESGRLVEFPQVGGVYIADDVLIGRNSIVDRGALADTVVCRGVKIDDLAVIAHNVRVGRDSVIGCHAAILGSAVIEAGACVSTCACVREGLRIGAGSVVGMGAVVTRDVPDGAVVYGVPSTVKGTVCRWWSPE